MHKLAGRIASRRSNAPSLVNFLLPERAKIISSGAYFLNPTTNHAEVAYMIAPAWQSCGVGGALQKRLREFAQARRVRGFIAEILPSNEKMIKLARNAGDRVMQESDEARCKIVTTFKRGGLGPFCFRPPSPFMFDWSGVEAAGLDG